VVRRISQNPRPFKTLGISLEKILKIYIRNYPGFMMVLFKKFFGG
jgi:hypothetical protein